MARILVLDGHSSAALAIVRSLGRAGHWVAVGFSEGLMAPAAHSKFCRRRIPHPSPLKNEAEFLKQVLTVTGEEKLDLLMPAAESSLWPLVSHRGELPPATRLAAGSREALEQVSDKRRVLDLARQAGIDVPQTSLVRSLGDLNGFAPDRLPVVIKDRWSVRWNRGQALRGGASYAFSGDELRRKVERKLEAAEDVLVQEFVAGMGVGFSCFLIGGELYMPFQWRRLREKDPRGSGSSARQSVPVDANLAARCRELLRLAGFEGLAMVEFKQDAASGRTTLMEVNARPWGSMQLPIHCGVDYPRYLAAWYLEGKTPDRDIPYKAGIVCRWLSADLTHLENAWTGKPEGWPGEFPSFASSFFRVMVPWYPGLRADHFSWSDPAPAWVDLKRWWSGRRQGSD